MSASFYDLLKYAKTGIAAPDMTAYDKMRAVAMAGGKVKTLTGVPPLSFKSNGKPLISCSMKGNGQQSGTPTPQNIIMPDLCGVRTGNLWNYTIEQGGWLAAAGSIPKKTMPYDTAYTSRCRVAEIMPIPSNTMSLTCQSGIKINFVWVDTNGVSMGGSGWQQSGSTVTAPDNAVSLTFILAKVDNSICSQNDFKNIMLTSGSTALDYEPYGWAEKITCAGQTTPVYLGQTPTVRRVKKLVLTGKENWGNVGGDAPYRISLTDIVSTTDRDSVLFLSSHYLAVSNSASWSQYSTCVSWAFAGNINAKCLQFRDTNQATLADFKAYIAAQYAAGTPVTVWYVLATEQTGIVNEPLAKIGDYADELHSTDAGVSIPTAKGQNTLTVDTELQPSSMTITFK